MSGRLDNVSFNPVDDRARDALAACTTPSELASWLDGLVLPPRGEDEVPIVEMWDEGRFPPLLEPGLIVELYRADRARFRDRAIELYFVEELTREKLAELTFPSGMQRTNGAVSVAAPVLVLASCAPRFAAWLLDRRGPWLAPVPNEAVTRAFGGLDEKAQPCDVWYRASDAKRCADELARTPFAPSAIDPRLKAYVRDYLPHIESVADHIHAAVKDVVELYRQAAANGHGVDVHWHANP